MAEGAKGPLAGAHAPLRARVSEAATSRASSAVAVSRRGGFLEEDEGGQGLAGDVQIAEDGHHLVGELADLGGLPLLQVRDRQIEGGECGVKGVAVGEKRLADLGQKPAGAVVISEAGGYPPFHPIQADAVLRAPVSRGQAFRSGRRAAASR